MEISGRATQALAAAAVGLVVVVAVRFALNASYERYERRLLQRDPATVARRRTTFNFVRRVVVTLVASILTWNVLSLYDATASIGKALLASSAVLAVFAGLAFSTPLSNLGAGLLVAFTQPLRLGDRVSVAGETGFVEEMNLIYTTLVTDDARRVFVPNTHLTTNAIVNRTIKDPQRLVAASFPVSIETPLNEAIAALQTAIAELPGTMDEGSRVRVGDIADRTVWLEAAVYAPLGADVVSLSSELRRRGLEALRDAGFLAG